VVSTSDEIHTELSPTFYRALQALVTAEEAEEARELLQSLTRSPDELEEDEETELDVDAAAASAFSCPTSTSDLERLSADELWDMLGCTDRFIPGMARVLDRTGSHTLTNRSQRPQVLREMDTALGRILSGEEDEKWEKFTLKWHQLVGVVRMVELCFAGKPCLLMDEVGVGKTVETLAAIAALAHLHNFYQDYGHYPRAFRTFTNKPTRIDRSGTNKWI